MKQVKLDQLIATRYGI